MYGLPIYDFMGVWHKSRNFSVHHIDLRPGVVGYISNPIALFSKNSITIDIFGNSFYRNYDFGAGDDTGIYWNSEVQYPKETMLYFTTAMEKALFGKYSYGKNLEALRVLISKCNCQQKIMK